MSQVRVSQLLGRTAPLVTWFAVAEALGRRLRVELGRDPNEDQADAGHLKVQELVLRLGRDVGYRRAFELPTKPADPSRSVDVCLRDDRGRRLLIVECWNSIGDIGAAARATNRKVAEADALAAAAGGDQGPYELSSCWVVRATVRNRALVARYPEVFAARFPGSSRRWVAALTKGGVPRPETGLVWCDVSATRLLDWRRPHEAPAR